jgi:uncharacterized C2H2 Zn-finger protein
MPSVTTGVEHSHSVDRRRAKASSDAMVKESKSQLFPPPRGRPRKDHYWCTHTGKWTPQQQRSSVPVPTQPAGGARVRVRVNAPKMHACPRCASVFTQASGLSLHVRSVHEKRRDHACPLCAAAFCEASKLTRHVRTVHEQRRDHACPHCTAAFKRAEDLTAHVRAVHEKRRDHACPHCTAAFAQAGNLRVHMRTVHKNLRGHACPHCAAAFGKASDLTKHVRTGHEQNTMRGAGAVAPTLGRNRSVTSCCS